MSKVDSEDAKNMASLVAIQASNTIAPLLLFPLAITKLGPDIYSGVVITEVFMFFALTSVLYSFDVIAVKEVQTLRFGTI